MEQIPSTEKVLRKMEIDQQIEALSKKHYDLAYKKNLLSTNLARLVHDYGQGKEGLDVFKDAKELLEKRIENPTLSDKLMDRFAVLFGKEEVGTDPVESKHEFLDRRSLTGEARGYRESGSELRETVKSIASEKDVLRELMGEDLSFRGGTVEGEENAPREESIKKIEYVIKSIDAELSENAKKISVKREEALEAWKRENPDEWAKIEEQEKAKEETKRKIALFKELLIVSGGRESEPLVVLEKQAEDLDDIRSEGSYELFRECRKMYLDFILDSGLTGGQAFVLALRIPSDPYNSDADERFLSGLRKLKNVRGMTSAEREGRGFNTGANSVDIYYYFDEGQGDQYNDVNISRYDSSIKNKTLFLLNAIKYLQGMTLSEVENRLAAFLRGCCTDNRLSKGVPTNLLEEFTRRISGKTNYSHLEQEVNLLKTRLDRLSWSKEEYQGLLKEIDEKKVKEIREAEMQKSEKRKEVERINALRKKEEEEREQKRNELKNKLTE